MENWYHHNLNPYAIDLFGVSIPWYWIIYVAGWFWCDFAGRRYLTATSNELNRPKVHAAFWDFMFWGWIALLVGARVTYILIYNFEYYQTHPDQIPAIWNGGMSFHGGLIGVALAGWIIAKRHGVSLYSITDPLAISVPLVVFFGRVANFLNGELPGRASNLPWAVVFPEPYNDVPRHPSQIYEAFAEGLLVWIILNLMKHKLKARVGGITFAFLGLYASARFFVEFTRQPDPQIGLIAGLTMGQWLSLLLGAISIIGLRAKKHATDL